MESISSTNYSYYLGYIMHHRIFQEQGMENFFSYDYSGEPFIFFGTAHIGALLAIVLLNIFLLRYKDKDESIQKKSTFGVDGYSAVG